MELEDLDTFYAPTQQEWRQWLIENHEKMNSVWLIFYKKGSNKPSVPWSKAVDEALCFGWIDSKAKTIDENRYMQFFSKRKPTSTWSKINKDKVKRLIASKLMTKAGHESIEIAKQNGSWTILDSVEALIIPDDLEQEFTSRPGSKDYFLGLSKSSRKILLSWIVLAKRKETKQKRIIEIAENASQKMMPKPFR